MLPSAYRTDASPKMTAILEDSSDVNSQSQPSVIISEGGFTDDESSRDSSFMNAASNDEPILGARSMDETLGADDEEYTFDYDSVSEPSIPETPTETSNLFHGPADV